MKYLRWSINNSLGNGTFSFFICSTFKISKVLSNASGVPGIGNGKSLSAFLLRVRFPTGPLVVVVVVEVELVVCEGNCSLVIS
ncbi:unnamed protein product [Schistosoma mattheei]|uniref:Uncharacterized protein n=1 Tax=Schistosoma mattheei TaxID=31246 RepID=A0A3P8AFT1_9TREM|nr:unnamed protein product [Schistosoma mattheei]